ncbi:MAG: hypothetical protein ACOC7X_05710 [Spirochaetota bacterium]
MDTGDRLYKRMQSTVHSHTLTAEEKKNRLKQDFMQSVAGVPVEMLDELFEVMFFASNPSEDELLRQAEAIPELSELLLESFDESRDPFSREQWHQIGEIVSDFGVKLDESLLTYVMAKVVERGAI